MRHISSKANERLGKIFETKTSGKIKIIEYITADNITIEFIETGDIKKQVKFCHIKVGNVSSKKDLYIGRSNELIRIGETNISKHNELQKIINYKSSKFIDIEFTDGTILENVTYQSFKEGSLLHPNFKHKSRLLLGIGYNSQGKHSSYDKKYGIWFSILDRIFNEKHEFYYLYKECSIVDEWKDFQNFGDWYDENYINGFHLDKDILFKGNKIYGPETCCFIPQEINKILTKGKRTNLPSGVCLVNNKYQVQISKFSERYYLGTYNTIEEAFKVYKFEKENHIKNVAYEWKDKISGKVYQALINYKVEITD